MGLINKVRQFRQSGYLPVRLIYYILKPLGFFIRLLRDAPYRNGVFTATIFRNKYRQRSILTKQDRYPLLFASAAKYLSTYPHPRILSFGCSTGEEVFSIGNYIPDADITGVDINRWCIGQCKIKYPSERFSFMHSLSSEFILSDKFDAVFCMAVFQRAENRLNKNNKTSDLYTFIEFESDITMLHEKLNPGGLFIIDNADFSFADTSCSRFYTPLDFENNRMVRNRPLFDKLNKKIADTQNNYRIFVKIHS